MEEADQLANENTRKSSRQKTPNTYYKQDISDTRLPEPKQPKSAKTTNAALPAKATIVSSSTTANTAAATTTLSKSSKKKPTTQQPVLSTSSGKRLSDAQDPETSENKNIESIPPRRLNTTDASSKPQSSKVLSSHMEIESDPASDAPEGSDHIESISLSGNDDDDEDDDSKKSNQNNATNTSNTDQEDNRAGGAMSVGGAAYQTRKIRKKPRFADENYEDNMPIPKSLQPKKTKLTKSEIPNKKDIQKSKSTSASGTIISAVDDAPAIAQASTTVNGSSSSNIGINNPKQSKAVQKATSKKEKQQNIEVRDGFNTNIGKKDKFDNIQPKGDLLDIFLDAVTGVQVKSEPTTKLDSLNDISTVGNNNASRKPSSNNQQFNQAVSSTSSTMGRPSSSQNQYQSQSNNQNQSMSASSIDLNTSSLLNLFNQFSQQLGSSATENASNPPYITQQNSIKQKRSIDERQQLKSQHLEDSTTTKKKIKTSSKRDPLQQGQSQQQHSFDDLYKTQSASNLPLQTNNGILLNGTVYNFPNIQQRNDYITHVEKSKDKFVIHHSSLAPMEVHRMFLKDEVTSKINIQKLIGQITMQQIAQHQREVSLNPIPSSTQKFSSVVPNLLQKVQQNVGSLPSQQQQQYLQQQQQLNLFATASAVNSSTNLSQPSDKSNFIQFALQQLQQRAPLSMFPQQQSSTDALMYQAGIQLQNNRILGSLGSASNASNFMSLKNRSQSVEFDSSLAQRRLSEHFKIGPKQSPASTGEEKYAISRKSSQSHPDASSEKLSKSNAKENKIEIASRMDNAGSQLAEEQKEPRVLLESPSDSNQQEQEENSENKAKVEEIEEEPVEGQEEKESKKQNESISNSQEADDVVQVSKDESNQIEQLELEKDKQEVAAAQQLENQQQQQIIGEEEEGMQQESEMDINGGAEQSNEDKNASPSYQTNEAITDQQ